jgi:predicted site-specific integrase-resolvase
MELVSISKVCKIVGVTPQTLRNWDKNGKLKPIKRMKNGYRYYDMQDIISLKGETQDRIVIGYCRVSSVKQKDDLERQIENVKTYMLAKGYQFQVIQDIGSGINYTKNGLLELLSLITQYKVAKIVVLYKDRLVRFGFELIQELCKKFDCEIEIIDSTEKTQEQELVEDLIQIVTVFSCRLQGSRSKKTKELINVLKND